MKKLLLILIVLMVFIFPSKSIATQYIGLGFEDEVSYQYYYCVIEGVMKVEFVSHIKDDDDQACAEVVNAKIGDTFTGLSGTTYVLQEQNILCEEQIQYLANQGIVIVGEWVPIDEANSIDANDLQDVFSQFQEQYTEPERTNYTETELTLEDISWGWVEGIGYMGTVESSEEEL